MITVLARRGAAIASRSIRRVRRFPTAAGTAAIALALVLGVGDLPAQGRAALQPIPVAEAIRDRNGDLVADRVGDTVMVQGTVTTAPFHRGSRRYVMLQDESGAVRLRTRRSNDALNALAPGQLVRVQGTVRVHRAMDELDVHALNVIGSARVPRPTPALVANLIGERYAGQWVSVVGEWRSFITPGADTANRDEPEREYEIRDRSGAIRVRMPSDFLDTPGADLFLRGGSAEVVALLAQSDPRPPFDGDYRLEILDLSHVRFAPLLPIWNIAGGIVIVLLTGVVIYSVLRRRRAERRATETEWLYADLQLADDALRKSIAWNNATFESVAVGIAHQGEDGRWLRVNPAFCVMLGYSADELLALDSSAITHTDDISTGDDQRNALFQGHARSYTRQKRYIRKNGDPLWAEVTVTISEAEGTQPRHLIVVATDISDRKTFEARLRQSQKMEAVGELAGGVAHDFNNLLTVITGCTSMLLERSAPSDPAVEDLKEIQTAADRAASLTKQLLAFSRKQLLQPRVLNLNEVVTGVTPMLRRLIGEDIRIISNTAPDVGSVLADPGQIEQVIVNLAVNARDAMPGGGTLRIETSTIELTEREARRFRAEVPPGSYAVLSIVDTGRGMDAATESRIFEPFFTTKELGKGTGLGLATVYGVIKQSGGFIWVSSKLGVGTTFEVYLPRVPSETVTQPEPVPSVPRPGGSERILLVEDEEALRRLAWRILTGQGYAVLEAVDGASALELIRHLAAPVDLVLTDLVMPGMSGVELASEVEKVQPGVAVVYMSGYTDDEILRRGLREDHTIFIQKPFDAATLLRVVRDALDGSREACLDSSGESSESLVLART